MRGGGELELLIIVDRVGWKRFEFQQQLCGARFSQVLCHLRKKDVCKTVMTFPDFTVCLRCVNFRISPLIIETGLCTAVTLSAVITCQSAVCRRRDPSMHHPLSLCVIHPKGTAYGDVDVAVARTGTVKFFSGADTCKKTRTFLYFLPLKLQLLEFANIKSFQNVFQLVALN